MSDECHVLIDEHTAEELDEHGDLAPPWARYPDIPNGSIGWRMGGGEGWLMMWWEWMKRQPVDRPQRLAYLQRHPPAPRSWEDSVLWVVDPSLSDEEDEDDGDDALDERRRALLHELEQAGAIGDDVAIVAWLARNDPPEPPWATERSLESAVRYDARALGFLARWAQGRREEGTLAAWLRAAPEPSGAWLAFRDALATGQPPTTLPADCRQQLAILLAAAGEPPPPWTRGEPPEAIEQRFEDDTTYAGAWAEWAMESFDDPTTWMGYLRRHPAAPPQWDEVVRAELSWLFHEP